MRFITGISVSDTYERRQVEELISAVPYLAAKTLETHMLLLSPIFGKDALLGVATAASRVTRAGSVASSVATGHSAAGSEEGHLMKKV